MQKRTERIGEINYNSSGELMEVIDYNTCLDMTVRFEDGTIRNHIQYNEFLKGRIRRIKRKPRIPATIGETCLTKQGVKMKVVDIYRVSKHPHNRLEIEFEDGIRVRDVIVGNFRKGSVVYPKR